MTAYASLGEGDGFYSSEAEHFTVPSMPEVPAANGWVYVACCFPSLAQKVTVTEFTLSMLTGGQR